MCWPFPLIVFFVSKSCIFKLPKTPWHIFTWGEVDAVERLEALNLQNNIDLNAVVTFSGFPDDFSKIKMIKSRRELNELLQNIDDVYITALDFSWTFVKTHEDYIGPYFKFRDR